MLDTLVYGGIAIVGLGAVLCVFAPVVIGRLLPKRDTHPMGEHPLWQRGGFPPRPQEPPEEDEDDVGGSFTCFFCGLSYDVGAKDCICHGCNRYVCLACTYYEEDQTPGGPDGPHTAADHPAYERHAR